MADWRLEQETGLGAAGFGLCGELKGESRGLCGELKGESPPVMILQVGWRVGCVWFWGERVNDVLV